MKKINTAKCNKLAKVNFWLRFAAKSTIKYCSFKGKIKKLN